MEQTYEWIRLAQAGDAAAKDNLLQENSGLIWSVVGRFRGRGEPEGGSVPDRQHRTSESSG